MFPKWRGGEEEKKVDATVFEYDEVWDKMQETKARQKEAKEADSKERKVRALASSLVVCMPTLSDYSQNISADCLTRLLLGGWTTSGQRRR